VIQQMLCTFDQQADVVGGRKVGVGQQGTCLLDS
jgi:hypothetical protein